MAESVFKNDYKSAQSWDMQGAIIYFVDCNRSGLQTDGDKREPELTNALIVQNLNVTFGRSVSKIYPINISQAIQILGIPEGSATIGLIWGPGDAFKNFVECFKDSCATYNSGKSIHIKPFGTKCENGETGKSWGNSGELTIMSPVLSGLGVTIQAAQGNAMPVTASVSLSFIDLQLS